MTEKRKYKLNFKRAGGRYILRYNGNFPVHDMAYYGSIT